MAPLARGRLSQPHERLLHGRALDVAQLVLGQERLGRALQLGEKIRIDHDPAHELAQPLRHLADHTNFSGALIGSGACPARCAEARGGSPPSAWRS
jgi:hypothetical protein